jgi:hypothetical protein
VPVARPWEPDRAVSANCVPAEGLGEGEELRQRESSHDADCQAPATRHAFSSEPDAQASQDRHAGGDLQSGLKPLDHDPVRVK